MVVRVLQLTDTHLFFSKEENLKSVVTYNSLEKVISLANASGEEFSFVALTGDLSQDGTVESYNNLGNLVSLLRRRAFYIPGNHDNRENMHEALSNFGDINNTRVVFENSWIFVFLDSKLDGKVEGFLPDKEISDLRAILEENKEKYVAVFLHHNPVNTDASRIDSAMLTNCDQFLALVLANQNVKAVISGHVHQDYVEMRDQVQLISTPSTCVQFKPSVEGVLVDDKKPGFRLLDFLDDGSITTEVIRIIG